MSRFDRMKRWIKSHPDLVGVGGAVLGSTIAVVMVKKRNAASDDTLSVGDKVYYPETGSIYEVVSTKK